MTISNIASLLLVMGLEPRGTSQSLREPTVPTLLEGGKQVGVEVALQELGNL